MEAIGNMRRIGVKPSLLLADAAESPLSLFAIAQGWQVTQSHRKSGYEHANPAIDDRNVAVVVLGEPGFSDEARRRYPGALLVGTHPACKPKVDLFLGSWNSESLGNDKSALERVLQHAQSHWRMHSGLETALNKVAAQQQQMQQLSEVSATLSSQMSFNELLATLLKEARAIARCDGASLYLIESKPRPDGNGIEDQLVFKLTQSGTVDLPFQESTVPLSAQSIAGYVAVSGQEVWLRDAYKLPVEAPYSFNRSFDERMNYRTQSMLVMPMRAHDGAVVGVLQFINRLEDEGDTVVEFDKEAVEILRAIANQAALSIQKNRLVRDINELFESFVQASVKAIEQRDPSTSGHSGRVAETTVALLQALPLSNLPRFKRMVIPEDHLREVRYAALLHDFGKVGVREAVLVKSHKLTSDRMETLHYRVQLQKERLRREAAEKELHLLHHKSTDFEVARARVHRELQKQLSILDDYYGMIEQANNPTVVLDGDFSHLRQLHEYSFSESDGSATGLISADDLHALSVRRGSLTAEERIEIEAHVSWTKEFLSVLPWPKELSQVPEIAGAHHEKLNGTGYPEGLSGAQIPLASRVMTVCDIYDALTSMDRPYKSAMGDDRAFDILYGEAKEGLLDADLVDIFVASRNSDQLRNTSA